jgi:hypothetical protein
MKPLKLRRFVIATFLVMTITPLQVVLGQSSKEPGMSRHGRI